MRLLSHYAGNRFVVKDLCTVCSLCLITSGESKLQLSGRLQVTSAISDFSMYGKGCRAQTSMAIGTMLILSLSHREQMGISCVT